MTYRQSHPDDGVVAERVQFWRGKEDWQEGRLIKSGRGIFLYSEALKSIAIISCAQRLCLDHIASHFNAELGYAFVSQEEVARHCRTSLSVVERAVRVAKRIGIISTSPVSMGALRNLNRTTLQRATVALYREYQEALVDPKQCLREARNENDECAFIAAQRAIEGVDQAWNAAWELAYQQRQHPDRLLYQPSAQRVELKAPAVSGEGPDPPVQTGEYIGSPINHALKSDADTYKWFE